MERIVMLLQEKKSAALMRDRLAANYQVLETEIDQSLDFSFDLGIVDESALKQIWEGIQSRREAAKPVFLPFLLVAARRNTTLVTRHLWQTVDEIIWTPINHLELQTRVENLLRSRRLSLEAQRLTTTDLITGVHNRRHFFTLGNRELNRARRFNRPLSVLMAEVDHFQGICDNYDYEVGNQALRLTAKRLLKDLRIIDVLGRYAEEKFVILLADTDMNGAERVAARLVRQNGDAGLSTDRGSITPPSAWESAAPPASCPPSSPWWSGPIMRSAPPNRPGAAATAWRDCTTIGLIMWGPGAMARTPRFDR